MSADTFYAMILVAFDNLKNPFDHGVFEVHPSLTCSHS
jgi:hypothetical protein